MTPAPGGDPANANGGMVVADAIVATVPEAGGAGREEMSEAAAVGISAPEVKSVDLNVPMYWTAMATTEGIWTSGPKARMSTAVSWPQSVIARRAW